MVDIKTMSSNWMGAKSKLCLLKHLVSDELWSGMKSHDSCAIRYETRAAIGYLQLHGCIWSLRSVTGMSTTAPRVINHRADLCSEAVLSSFWFCFLSLLYTLYSWSFLKWNLFKVFKTSALRYVLVLHFLLSMHVFMYRAQAPQQELTVFYSYPSLV